MSINLFKTKKRLAFFLDLTEHAHAFDKHICEFRNDAQYTLRQDNNNHNHNTKHKQYGENTMPQLCCAFDRDERVVKTRVEK